MSKKVRVPPITHRLRQPDLCRCGRVAEVTEVRRGRGYKRRRHWCRICDVRWNSFQSLIHPAKVKPKTSS